MQVRKQQLELDMEQQTGSILHVVVISCADLLLMVMVMGLPSPLPQSGDPHGLLSLELRLVHLAWARGPSPHYCGEPLTPLTASQASLPHRL